MAVLFDKFIKKSSKLILLGGCFAACLFTVSEWNNNKYSNWKLRLASSHIHHIYIDIVIQKGTTRLAKGQHTRAYIFSRSRKVHIIYYL